jgi:hypothetical protein
MLLCGPTGDAPREDGTPTYFSHTDTLYPASRYGTALAELNPALTLLSARWCVRIVL